MVSPGTVPRSPSDATENFGTHLPLDLDLETFKGLINIARQYIFPHFGSRVWKKTDRMNMKIPS